MCFRGSDLSLAARVGAAPFNGMELMRLWRGLRVTSLRAEDLVTRLLGLGQ